MSRSLLLSEIEARSRETPQVYGGRGVGEGFELVRHGLPHGVILPAPDRSPLKGAV